MTPTIGWWLVFPALFALLGLIFFVYAYYAQHNLDSPPSEVLWFSGFRSLFAGCISVLIAGILLVYHAL